MRKRTRKPRVKPHAVPATSPRSLSFALAALAGVGLLVSAYFTYAFGQVTHHLLWRSAFAHASPCDAMVLRPYAAIGAAPLGAFGLFHYGLAIVLLFGTTRARRWRLPRSPETFTLIWMGAATLVSLVVTTASLLDQRTVCPAILLLDCVNIASLAFAIRALRSEGVPLVEAIGLELDAGWDGWVLVSPVLFAIGALLLYSQGPLAPRPFCESLARAIASAKPVFIYSDFQCSHCKLADTALRRLYGRGLVAEHRQFPWDASCNPKAGSTEHEGECLQARAALCAAAAGRYDEYSARLYEGGPTTLAGLAVLASEVGMPGDAFAACVESAETRSALAEQIDAGHEVRIRGTPTFVIDGQVFVGFGKGENTCIE